jgi:hypothetical protein
MTATPTSPAVELDEAYRHRTFDALVPKDLLADEVAQRRETGYDVVRAANATIRRTVRRSSRSSTAWPAARVRRAGRTRSPKRWTTSGPRRPRQRHKRRTPGATPTGCTPRGWAASPGATSASPSNRATTRGRALGVPKTWEWSNFSDAWTQANMGAGLANSVIVVLGTIVLTCVVSACAAAPWRG